MAPPRPAPSAPVSTSPVAPFPDNTSADPVNLGTLTYGNSPCAYSGSIPIPKGYNTDGSTAWYSFTLAGNTQGCPGAESYVGLAPSTDTIGFFGVAASASGVIPDEKIGVLDYIPWVDGTYYLEVTGSGYFSVDIF